MMRNGEVGIKGLTKEEKDKNGKTRRRTKGKRKQKQNEWKIKINLNNQKKTKKSQPEFKYIDEVPKENLQGNRIFVDPEDHY
jgi:hypothetical protein